MVCSTILDFNANETEKCYNCSIIDDFICELEHKLFSVRLALISTNDQPIQIDSARDVANVFTDDSTEPECCKYQIKNLWQILLSNEMP